MHNRKLGILAAIAAVFTQSSMLHRPRPGLALRRPNERAPDLPRYPEAQLAPRRLRGYAGPGGWFGARGPHSDEIIAAASLRRQMRAIDLHGMRESYAARVARDKRDGTGDYA